MATQILTLRRGKDGYYRTDWYDDAGERHGCSFGNQRTQAQIRFAAFHARWQADPAVRNPDRAPPLTIRQGWERYHKWATAYYVRPDGTPTLEATAIGAACAKLLELYGELPAREMRPKTLKRLRFIMAADLCRNEINKRVRKVRAFFKWLVGEELIPAETWHALQAITAVDEGRPILDPDDEDGLVPARVPRETEPVEPVPDPHVWAVIEHAPPTIAAMVELQYWTGMRPAEVCGLRTRDLDMTGRVWIYRPVQHKTRYKRRKRIVVIGPKGQAVLRRIMPPSLEAFIFSPRRAMSERYAARPTHRHQPVKQPATDRRIRDHYETGEYAQAIEYVCTANEIPHWTPNQLRHNAGTRVRAEYGLEAAQVILGHARADVTQIYAERDLAKAKEVMERVG